MNCNVFCNKKTYTDIINWPKKCLKWITFIIITNNVTWIYLKHTFPKIIFYWLDVFWLKMISLWKCMFIHQNLYKRSQIPPPKMFITNALLHTINRLNCPQTLTAQLNGRDCMPQRLGGLLDVLLQEGEPLVPLTRIKGKGRKWNYPSFLLPSGISVCIGCTLPAGIPLVSYIYV